MPRYTFTLEKSDRVADAEATEDLPDETAAMESARLIAHDFAISKAAEANLRVVVLDEAGDEVGSVPIMGKRS